jgi:hypothetical protein
MQSCQPYCLAYKVVMVKACFASIGGGFWIQVMLSDAPSILDELFI